MNSLSDSRLKEVLEYTILNGIENASKTYSISQETISRYFREARARDILDNIEPKVKKPNVLLFDIETAPLNAAVWGLWKQNVNLEQIYSEWFMLTWSAKWLYDDKVYSGRLTKQEALDQDDSRITKEIWEFIDYADIIIAHNAWRFDVPRLNTRFLLNGFNPPSPYQVIDTLKVAKKSFGFSSNKLDFIARQLGLEGKADPGGMKTWNDIVRSGDEEALKRMSSYNDKDVLVLEDVYVKLRPWIKSHPNMSLYYGDIETRCPNCGSNKLSWDEDKFYVTPMNKYSAVRCDECGAVGRARESSLTKLKRDSLVSTTAR